MLFRVDRDLPVSIRAQLQGLIEYGIACGELGPGEPLPSVRDMAETLGVAPMTVTQVYRELKSKGLIEARPGSGTFVADSGAARAAGRPGAAQFQSRVDGLIDEGRALGMDSGELAALFNARLFYRASVGARRRIVMVGLFPAATASYAEAIGARIGARFGEVASVSPMTLAEIEGDPALRLQADAADLVVTFANRQRDLALLLPNVRVIAVSFLPSAETRRALASLDPLARVAVVSRFPEFLPIMTGGVRRFAPHVADIAGAPLESDDVLGIVERATVVVFATGAEDILGRVGPDVPAIEYRHTPDPNDIDRLILPALGTAGVDVGAPLQERQAS